MLFVESLDNISVCTVSAELNAGVLVQYCTIKPASNSADTVRASVV